MRKLRVSLIAIVMFLVLQCRFRIGTDYDA